MRSKRSDSPRCFTICANVAPAIGLLQMREGDERLRERVADALACAASASWVRLIHAPKHTNRTERRSESAAEDAWPAVSSCSSASARTAALRLAHHCAWTDRCTLSALRCGAMRASESRETRLHPLVSATPRLACPLSAPSSARTTPRRQRIGPTCSTPNAELAAAAPSRPSQHVCARASPWRSVVAPGELR